MRLSFNQMRKYMSATCMLTALLAGFAVFTSCSDEDISSGQQSESICFNVGITDKSDWSAATRSAQKSPDKWYEAQHLDNSDLWLLTSVEEGIDSTLFSSDNAMTRGTTISSSNFYSSFGVYAYLSNRSEYINNAEVKKSGSLWALSPSRFWPGGNYTMKFIAYAPYNATGLTFTDNTPTLSYTVPAEVKSQNDLLLATPDDVNGDYNASLPLNFKHLLTAVKVKIIAGFEGTVTEVKISGVKGSGTFSGTDNTWTTSGDDCEYAQSMEKTLDSEATEDTPVMSDDDGTTFMMIPQTLGESATLSVTIKNSDNTTTTLTGSLSGKEWEMGYTVTYRISTTEFTEEPVFTVTGTSTFSYQGGKDDYTVQSYIKRTKGSTISYIATSWTAEFVEDDGNGGYTVIDKPDWATLATTSGNGVSNESDIESYIATIDAQTAYEIIYPVFPETTINQTTGLTVYNLSNSNGKEAIENTANCYIVNQKGTYSLPLVYGNAIKNSSTNESAYTSTSTRSNILKTFINHLGRGITSPYIYENVDENGNKLEATSVELVWQDAKGLISSIALSDDKKSLVFEVGTGEDGIHQGNAVLAVKDANGQIMWSWHIWVTDYVLGEDLRVVNYTRTVNNSTTSKDYYVLPINLGWCVTSTTYYEGRSVKVRFTQSGTNLTQVITLTQEVAEVPLDGNQTYYQWGRKDPMLPNIGTNRSYTNKTWYDFNGNSSTVQPYTTKWASSTSSETNANSIIVDLILNPFTYNSNQYMDYYYYNLWSTEFIGRDSFTSTKSVYDPSPAGYKVPPQNVFKSFTVDNGVHTYDPIGWYFPCKKEDGTYYTIYFPTLGYRGWGDANQGKIVVGSNQSFHWAASGDGTINGHLLMTADNNGVFSIYTSSSTPRSYGCGIRACKED